jgi:hypothetical protein
MIKQSFDLKNILSTIGSGIQKNIVPAGIGAGIGAAGLGLAGHFGDQGEDPEIRKQHLRNNLLMGAGLGGIGGVAANSLSHLVTPETKLNENPLGKLYVSAHNATSMPVAAGVGAGILPAISDYFKDKGRLLPGGKSQSINDITGAVPREGLNNFDDKRISELKSRVGNLFAQARGHLTPRAFKDIVSNVHFPKADIDAEVAKRTAATGNLAQSKATTESLVGDNIKKILGSNAAYKPNARPWLGLPGRISDKVQGAFSQSGGLNKLKELLPGTKSKTPGWRDVLANNPNAQGMSLGKAVSKGPSKLPFSLNHQTLLRSGGSGLLGAGAAAAANRYMFPALDSILDPSVNEAAKYYGAQ